MQVQIARCLRYRHPAFPHQLHCFQFELTAELPSLHLHPPVPKTPYLGVHGTGSSSLIKCNCCGASYTISGKDYYRCAGQKERDTCSNTLSVRKAPVEAATLAVLQHHLLTENYARLFAKEFGRETARIAAAATHRDEAATDRLAVVAQEIDNLAANMLTAVASPTRLRLLAEREAEKLD